MSAVSEDLTALY